LRNSSGKTVSAVKRGYYLILVRDRSRRQNFRLTGKDLSRKTTARFVGSVRWRLRLAAGRYTFRSDEADSLQGGFVVR
jgi:hypothetical protein